LRCREKEACVSTVGVPVRDRFIQRVPFHYGWVILASGALGAFMTTPGQTIGVSSFFDPVARDVALSRAEVALYYTIGTLAGIFPAPLVGHWIDRRGPRLTAGVIALAVTLACSVMALAQSALTLTLGFAVLRGSAVGALSLVSQHVINLWFVSRRGMAAAAASLGYALGGMVFPPMVNILMHAVGWRYTYVVLGVLVGATMLPVGLLVFRNRPEHFGLLPDLGAQAPRTSTRVEPAFTRAQAMRTVVFWTLSAANVLSNALGTGLVLNHYDLLARVGFPREAAVMVFTPLALTQVLASVSIGPVIDRLPPHRLVTLPMTAMACACMLVGAIGSSASAVAYAVALGVALGSFQALNAAVYAHYFGRTHAGEIRGVTFVITILGAAAGPLPFGWFSTHGSYFPVLAGGAALCLVAAAVNLVVKEPRPVSPEVY
jgi:MFS family permease